MNGNIEYIVAGGPLHGRTYPTTPSTDAPRGSASTATDNVTQIDALLRDVDAGALRIAAKRRLSDGDTVRYIVLHPQATGEQFLTILAA